MLRTTLAKIKKVCTYAIVPRILQGEAKHVQKKLTKNSMVASRAAKSTSSNNSGSKDNTEHNDKQVIQILEKPDEGVKKAVAQPPDDNREICNRIINKIFENDPVANPVESATVNAISKADHEQLEQKMEKLDETPVVPSPPKFEEQTAPRVIGNQQVLNTFTGSEFSESKTYDSSFDDIARKCLRVPPNEVDECIIKELRQYYEQSKGKVYEGTTTERYYSQAIYNPQQIIHLGKVNSVTEAALHSLESAENEDNVINVYKAHITQPLLFDTLSVYGEETDLNKHLLERPDFETPLLLNPYDDNSIFPLHEYVLGDELLLEAPKVEETMTVTEAVKESEFGNNEVMPPAEMEIESEQPTVNEQLQGTVAGISLGVPENITASNSPHTSQMTGIDDNAFVYTQHTHQPPPTDPPAEWQTQIGQHTERQPVIPNTSISGKIPDLEKKRRQHTSDTAISSHQNLHDLYMIGVNNNLSEIQEIQAENPNTNVLLSAEYKLDIQENAFEIPRRDPFTHFICEPEPKEKPEEESISNPDNIANISPKEMKNIVTTKNLESKMATTTGPIPDIHESDIPLKEMLRRVRERHRQELCRNFFQEASQFQLSTSCKPKTPFPPPCKEKLKSESTKSSDCSTKKDPYAPDKDSCSKFTQLGNQIYNSICFIRLTHFNSFGNTQTMPIINYQPYKQYSKAISTTTLQIHCLKGAWKENPFDEIEVENVGDVILSRDYEPWTPIPSWPIPRRDIKKKVVCPKEGCKLLPPPPLKPAEKDKPCVSFPKKTFSLAELFEHQPVTSVRY